MLLEREKLFELLRRALFCCVLAAELVAAEESLLLGAPELPGFSSSVIDPAQRSSAAKVNLLLPGERTALPFVIVSAQLLSLPMYVGGETREFSAVVRQVAGTRHRRGVLVSSFIRPKAVFGFLVEEKPGEEAVFYGISPVDSEGRGNLSDSNHRVTRALASEILQHAGSGPHDLLSRPPWSIDLPQAHRTRKAEALDQWREVELVVDGSGDFVRGRSEEEAGLQVVQAVAATNLFYQPLKLHLKLSALRLFPKDAPGDLYYKATLNKNARAMLDTMRGDWEDREEPERDIGVVLAASNFSNVFGLAYPATACLMPKYSFVFATQGGTSALKELALPATMAHEIGHTLGMEHDLDANSLMAPFYSLNPGGFSAQSIKEYQLHASKGGDLCFSPISPPDDTITPDGVLGFVDPDGLVLEVFEGQTLKRVFGLTGRHPDVRFIARGLPPGAQLSSVTGELSYKPDFETAGRDVGGVEHYEVEVDAVAVYATATLRFKLLVHDVNRPPLISAEGGEILKVNPGEMVSFRVSAYDPDQQDQPRLSLFDTTSERYPGLPMVRTSGGEALVSWAIPSQTVGSFPFVFLAVDESGATDLLMVRVEVLQRNQAPEVFLPEKYYSKMGEVVSLEVVVRDAENDSLEFSVQGLPDGSLIEKTPTGAVVTFVPDWFSNKEMSFALQVHDGMNVVNKSTVVYLDEQSGLSSQEASITWPGSPTSQSKLLDYDLDGQPEFVFYEANGGYWGHLDCSGDRKRGGQFGGFLGDVPLHYLWSGRPVYAVYRVIEGQGWWFVSTPDGIKAFAWGLADDSPVAADFDGDGFSDRAVFRPETGEWLIEFSMIGVQRLADTSAAAKRFGSSVVPFADDVDGDGLADRILYGVDNGSAVFKVWFASGQRAEFIVGTEQVLEARQPYVGDVDGDGRSDFSLLGDEAAIFSSKGGKVERIRRRGDSGRLFGLLGCAKGAEIIGIERTKDNISLLEQQKDFQIFSAVRDFPVLSESERLLAEYGLRRTRALNSRVGISEPLIWRPTADVGGRLYVFSDYRSRLFRGFIQLPDAFPLGKLGGSGDYLFFSDGVWLSLSWGGSQRRQLWGIEGDLPAAGDYNGDGEVDFAVYRPASAQWWILYRGTTGTLGSVMRPWGEQGDIPVASDYDGDGKQDIAVWRPSTGEWFIVFADGSVRVLEFGAKGDIPIPGDYLGYGFSQPALYREELGLWLIYTKAGVVLEQWGLAGDTPLRMDRNRDGRQDLAVFRESLGMWFVRTLDSVAVEVFAEQFGLPGDLPFGAVR